MSLLDSITPLQWALIGVSGLLIGMNKTGLMGAATAAIPIMASIFGAQRSVGLILPMLITADALAVIYYRRHADWSVVARLLPWALAGIAVGVVVGDAVPDHSFRVLLAVVVLAGLVLLAYKEVFHRDLRIPETWWLSMTLGLLAGFTTMVGNAAGSITTLYFLSMGMSKNTFIGTGAWFFFVVNVIKVPLHIVFWETISLQTLAVNAVVAPVILLGGVAGLLLVRHIKEGPYRVFILVVTALISFRLFL
ncbi:MAG: sulfite exporter TauE/SafE family protein [Spirochaetota bacterium]